MQEQSQTVRELVLSAAIEQGVRIPREKIAGFIVCVLREMLVKPLPEAIHHCFKEVVGPTGD